MTIDRQSLLSRLEAVVHAPEGRKWVIFIKKAKRYLILLLLSLVGGGFLLYQDLHLIRSQHSPSAPINADTTPTKNRTLPSQQSMIFVDLTGAVMKPKTYRVPEGTRLFELIEAAGGLDATADKSFIQRNYNFAVILTDQQKVHIPTIYETRDGIFTENRKLVSLNTGLTDQLAVSNTYASSSDSSSAISLNNGTLEELKILPGVGDVTGQRIMAGRPYAVIEDLLKKGIVKQSLYDKIVSQLVL